VMNILLPEATLIHEQWLHRKDEYAPMTYKQLEMGIKHRSIDYVRAKHEMEKSKYDINDLLGKVDILVMPTVPYPAPEEDPALEVDNEMKFTGLFNVTGHPALTMQVGFSKDKLPIGIQLIGKHHQDKTLLQIASRFEQAIVKKGG